MTGHRNVTGIVLVIAMVLFVTGIATAIDLNSSTALQYYGNIEDGTGLDFAVATNGATTVYGDLDLQNTNDITNFFQTTTCQNGFVTKIYSNGSYACESASFTDTDDQILGTSGNKITLTNSPDIYAPYANNSDTLDGQDGTYYLDNTDSQTLSYTASSDTIGISGGNTIDISEVDTDTDTDNQTLSDVLVQGNVANTTIRFSDGITIGDSSTTGSNTDSIAIGNGAAAPASSASAVGYSAAAGDLAPSLAEGATAFGHNATARGRDSSAFGYNAYAKYDYEASAFGSSSYATTGGSAFGYNSHAEYSGSAFGRNAEASAEGAVAIGDRANAPNSYEATFGNLNGEELDVNVTGNLTVHEKQFFPNGVEIGDSSTSIGNYPNSIAIGKDASSSGSYGTAVGFQASTGQGGAAFGTTADASYSQASAFGDNARAQSSDSSAFGAGALVTSNSALAVGAYSSVSGYNAVAFGNSASASKHDSLALGYNSTASAVNAVAIGHNAIAPNAYEATFGNLNGEELDVNVTGNLTVHGSGGLDLLNGGLDMNSNEVQGVSQVKGTNGRINFGTGVSTFVNAGRNTGYNLKGSNEDNFFFVYDFNQSRNIFEARQSGTVHIPSGNLNMEGHDVVLNGGYLSSVNGIRTGGAIEIGDYNTRTNGSEMTAIGKNARAQGARGYDGSVAIGTNAYATGSGSTAIGQDPNATGKQSVALGYGVDATGERSVGIGYYAEATAPSATVIGRYATASGNSASALGFYATASSDYSTALGDYANATAEGAVAIGDSAQAHNPYEATFGNLGDYPLDVNVTGDLTVHGSGGIEVLNGDFDLNGNSVINTNSLNFDTGVQIGYDTAGASAGASTATAIGYGASASNGNGVALGRGATAAESQATAIGGLTTAGANPSLALGYGANASAANALAIGASVFDATTASAQGAVAIGHSAQAPNPYEATFGNLNGQELDVNVTGDLTVHGSGGIEVLNGDLDLNNNTITNTGLESWTNVTYQNGWTHSTDAPGSYYKDPLGRVHLRGGIDDGFVSSVAFTLPSGYRPEYNRSYVVYSSSAQNCIVEVQQNGDFIAGSAGDCNRGYIELNGVSFRAE